MSDSVIADDCTNGQRFLFLLNLAREQGNICIDPKWDSLTSEEIVKIFDSFDAPSQLRIFQKTVEVLQEAMKKEADRQQEMIDVAKSTLDSIGKTLPCPMIDRQETCPAFNACDIPDPNLCLDSTFPFSR